MTDAAALMFLGAVLVGLAAVAPKPYEISGP